MKNVKHQIAEIDHLIANYQVQLKMLQVEILKLELKKEKLMDKIILQSLTQGSLIFSEVRKIRIVRENYDSVGESNPY